MNDLSKLAREVTVTRSTPHRRRTSTLFLISTSLLLLWRTASVLASGIVARHWWRVDGSRRSRWCIWILTWCAIASQTRALTRRPWCSPSVGLDRPTSFPFRGCWRRHTCCSCLRLRLHRSSLIRSSRWRIIRLIVRTSVVLRRRSVRLTVVLLVRVGQLRGQIGRAP